MATPIKAAQAGVSAPEQDQTAIIALADAATARADALSMKLYNLTEIVKLAAFAAEARRTLTGIESVMHYRPEMREAITTSVSASSNWSDLPDNTGDVLNYVAGEMGDIQYAFLKDVHDLAQAAKKGGAA
jgi:hypothetical protein